MVIIQIDIFLAQSLMNDNLSVVNSNYFVIDLNFTFDIDFMHYTLHMISNGIHLATIL